MIMVVLAAICALATATWIGYCAGRRARSRPWTWKKRTSRITLGRLAVGLLVLMTARRIRHSTWGLRAVEPLALLRGGVARLRSY